MLRGVMLGKRYEEIAQQLGISEMAVVAHARVLANEFGISADLVRHTQIRLAAAALDRGLCPCLECCARARAGRPALRKWATA